MKKLFLRYFRWLSTFALLTSFLIFLSVDTANNRPQVVEDVLKKAQASQLGGGGERHRLVSILGIGLVIVVGALVSVMVNY